MARLAIDVMEQFRPFAVLTNDAVAADDDDGMALSLTLTSFVCRECPVKMVVQCRHDEYHCLIAAKQLLPELHSNSIYHVYFHRRSCGDTFDGRSVHCHSHGHSMKWVVLCFHSNYLCASYDYQ